MSIMHRGERVTNDTVYHMKDTELEKVDKFKDLGVLFDPYLLFDTIGVSSKVDIARFPLRYATLRCDFSFDGYLHSSRLRNYGGCVHISLFLVQILWKKWQRRKWSIFIIW